MSNKHAALFAAIDEAARYKYHQVYQDLGLIQSKTGNFHCPNGADHGSGQDNNASLSINNETGQYRCHGGSCGIKGNLATYFKQYVVGTQYDKWDGHYTEFAKDYFGLSFMDSESEDFKQIAKQASALDFKKLVSPVAKAAEAIKYLPQEENDVFVNTLLRNPEKMKMVRDARNWDEALIQKYRIGYHSKKDAFTFPIIDALGNISNIKLYRPWRDANDWKWEALIKGNPIHPTPVVHLTHNKIYIFEGEPDMYMAASMGLYGITSGSASNFDYKKLFGPERFEQTFKDKIIVIVPDCDESGSKFTNMVSNQFVEVAQQVKIINLDKSETNPLGLDPTQTFMHNGKAKRKQKDMSDFFRINGFTEEMKKYFLNLESSTIAYAKDSDRKSTRTFKVSLNESLDSKYYDRNGNIHIETLGNVQDINSNVYKAPTQVCVACPALFDKNELSGICNKCSLPKVVGGFGSQTKKDFTFDLVPNYLRPVKNKHEISLKSKDILELIATTEKSRLAVKKRLLKIPDRCGECEIDDVALMSIQEVTLIKDMEVTIEENAEEIEEKRSNKLRLDQKNSTVAIPAYFLGETLAVDSIKANQCYRIKAVQTNIPDKQNTSLFCYSVTPQKDSFDSFKMSDDMAETLKCFRPKPGETIAQHFNRRYNVFGGAAGIDGREDVFFLCDLAYFSPIELNTPLIPGISRGWVEVLIAGDTRCGKSVAAEFLFSHYRMGQFIGGSRSVTTTGLLGGIIQSHNKPTISWGLLPQNDRGIAIFDEMSRLPASELSVMTDMRGSGIVEISKIVRGRAAARVRKIFMSNWRENDTSVNKSDLGIDNIIKLCGAPAVVSRFDAAIAVRNSDVLNFKSSYNKISSEFTSYQCRNLIMWTYSRTPSQTKFEEGFEEELNKAQDYFLATFHQDTHLVNQEMRAKLMRMTISVASQLFSTLDNDYETIYVKKEHLEYLVARLMKIYGKNSNMGLYEFTESMRGSEQLGDMKFMMNILEYVDLDTLIAFKEGYDKDISFLFSDYLLRVVKSDIKMVDGKANITSSGYKMYEALDKLIGTLFARNCFVRIAHRKIKKTDCFTEWLNRRKEQGDAAEKSRILECNETESNPGCGVPNGHDRRDITGNQTRVKH